ncbi:glutamate receptor ionotropic, kainate 2 isoform X2 [Lingula anatina]|uniref:Glutamate receptor ionotropic, kainate 2 isoform X2 n=1 Tax=Lingula anatina TaxID=7574 RepID=A0A1S3K3D1_LINAN|nr:glutamate receptor ionotropic, kainate 2 isoform X2 [Lingula anatina]|eukprot:XP_013416771.1 glutamate receptor ionotropic, kainate 2 isoform X2 [Lingula anatina]
MNTVRIFGVLAGLCLNLGTFILGQDTRRIKIGAVFEGASSIEELAFKYAVNKVNSEISATLNGVTLEYELQKVTSDSFQTSKKVCRLLKDGNGVGAIFGPMATISASHVQSICDTLEVPHIETRWDYKEFKDYYSVNLHPHYTSIGKSLLDLVTHWKWGAVTILYEDNNGLLKLQDLLRVPGKKKSLQTTIRKLEAFEDGDYRPLLKDLKSQNQFRFIVDCDYKKIPTLLAQAMSLSMLSQYYHFHFTSLDLDLLDLGDYRYGGANLTGFRLIDWDDPEVKIAMLDLASPKALPGTPFVGAVQTKTKVQAAVMVDAVMVFARAITDLSRSQTIQTRSLGCSNPGQTWTQGSSLFNFLTRVGLTGLTGRIKFDGDGKRRDFDLGIVKMGKRTLERIGFWTLEGGVNITANFTELKDQLHDTLQNKTLIVTTIQEPPYLMLRKAQPGVELKGNARFYGYCVDLLAEISKLLNFNFTIKLVDDGNYGAPVGPNGEWNGMVRELIDMKADLTVAPMTITYVREQVIDFTKPFMNLGISILFKKPEASTPDLFAFMSPLSFEVWLYMLAAYVGVSITLFVLARFSPYEWYNTHPCNQESDIVENQFNMLNSLWFTIGSLMQQGSDLAPRALSTRMISGIWWFFTLIMISSYTANLAAFLTVERMISPIENADDLAKQTDIKYGSQYGGSTMTFFKTSKIPTYERMWNFMSSTEPSVFVNSSKEGIDRVMKGKYAYLMESTMIEYTVQRNCKLMQVGGLLDSKGYGIGTPRGSPYTEILSEAILKLQEQQVLQVLYTKWWKEKEGGGQCEEAPSNKASELGVIHVGGVFVVLLAGLGLACLFALGEFIYKARQNADEDRQSICSEIIEELRFAIRCFGSSKKPAVHKSSHRKHDNGLIDNGMTMVPLTANNFPGKESFA